MGAQPHFDRRRHGGFTLLELMMVVAIIGLVMAMGIPAILSVTREAPLRRAVNDVMDLCRNARRQAILSNEISTITFHKSTRSISSSVSAENAVSSRMSVQPVTAVTLDDSVDIDFSLSDVATDDVSMNFYPNGTSDELEIVLSCNGEIRDVKLEPTTALPYVQTIK